MGCFLGSGWFCILMVSVSVKAQQMSSTKDHKPECLGNIVRLHVAAVLGNVNSIVNDSKVIELTPNLAAQCGFRYKFDRMGNAMLFASLLNCLAQSKDDKTLNLATQLRLHGKLMPVDYTCSYTWASREILCDDVYMEVSVRRTLPEIQSLSEQRAGARFSDPRGGAKAAASGYKMSKVVFSPSNKALRVDEVQRKGYAIANTPTRLVLRSPHGKEETYLQNVAGVPMKVLSTSIFFEQKWLVAQVDATVACPTQGSVTFTPELITWYLPRHIDPLFSSDAFTMLELYMGIDGKRLDKQEMAARKYSVSLMEVHVIVKIPVGAVGGYYKSHVQDNQYFSTYAIEPMLELLWIEEDSHEDTRYKVLFPITTPPVARPLLVLNYTPLDAVPEQALVFKLGTFNLDVELVNVTLSTGVLTVAECNARGFNVQEEMSEDNLSKSFSMAVPFMDPAVFHENRPEQGVTSFTLHLIYGLVVLPENMAFSHSASVNAILMNVVPHSISGVCDQENFYITVNYGNQAPLFEVMVGGWLLTAELAEQYVTEGESRITLTVPFSAPQTVFESIHASAVRSRLSVALLNPFTNVTMKDFTLGCTFHKRLTECFSNGTMTALAVKVESTPSLNPGQLTLTDRSCGPDYSDDRFAYFSFNVNSCGTTRKFIDDLILYENEISLPDKLKVKTASGLDDDYHLTVSCYYMINNTQSLAYHRKPCNNEPSAKTESQLLVVMRIATDASYKTFHQVEEYPVVRYLRQPLHIEVELTRSTDPEVELVLDHCWATLDKDRNSKPRWNLIIKGCEYPEDPYRVVFNTVVADSRVLYPSHFKRFEVHIAAFTGDVDELTDKVKDKSRAPLRSLVCTSRLESFFLLSCPIRDM
uniref:ZP domain-containing protein n=1 Tax=Esox lucius TaxID=8010 RepID=A0A3P8YDQ7_ESOLU